MTQEERIAAQRRLLGRGQEHRRTADVLRLDGRDVEADAQLREAVRCEDDADRLGGLRL